MNTTLMPRQTIRKLVDDYAQRNEQPAGVAWSFLYGRFELETNWNVRREAAWNDVKPLDLIDRLGRMDELLEIAMKALDPSAPDNKKAPRPGSFKGRTR